MPTIAVTLLIIVPVLPIAGIVSLAVVATGVLRGRATGPAAWWSAGVAALSAVVLIYWTGIQFDGVSFHETDETCIVQGFEGEYGGSAHSWIPLRSDVVCGGELHEMIPGWINPSMTVLLAVAAACLSVGALRQRAVGAPAAPAPGA